MVDAMPTPCHYANWNVGRNGYSTTPFKGTTSLMLLITSKLISTTFKKFNKIFLNPSTERIPHDNGKTYEHLAQESWVFAQGTGRQNCKGKSTQKGK